MFETRIDHRFPLGSLFVQVAASCVLCGVICIFSLFVVGDLIIPLVVAYPPDLNENLWSTITAFIAGFLFGMTVARFLPGAARSGRWVWVPPVTLFAVAFVLDSVQSSVREAMESCCFGTGKNGMGVFFLTCPTLTCIAYSIALATLAAHPRQRAS